MRALVVEDSKTVRMILSEYLRKMDIQVVEAANGREALERHGNVARRRMEFSGYVGPSRLKTTDRWRNSVESSSEDFFSTVAGECHSPDRNERLIVSRHSD